MKHLSRPNHAKLLLSIRRVLRMRQCRYTIAVLTALYSGGRENEVIGICKADLLTEYSAVKLNTLKQRGDEAKPRIIPLPRWVFKKLQRYANTVEGEQLFPFHDSTLRRQWYLIRPVALKFHSLRHTFAVYYYERTGHDIQLVSQLLGHSSVQMTMEYLQDLKSSDPDTVRSRMNIEAGYYGS